MRKLAILGAALLALPALAQTPAKPLSAYKGDPVAGEPLTINFFPAWPANAAELRVGESLTMPKFGLPQVRGQMSARFLRYPQKLSGYRQRPAQYFINRTSGMTARIYHPQMKPHKILCFLYL